MVPPTTTTTPTTTTSATTTTGPPVAVQVIRRGQTSRPLVALTFDGGSDTGHASEILDTLAGYGVRASFGLTGRWVEMNPELTERIAREGHVIINHTYSHPSFTGYSTGEQPLGEDQRYQQVMEAETVITSIAGASPRPLFRPPYGDIDDELLEQLGEWGYEWLVMWTVDSLGWNGLSSADIVERCLGRAESGAIYLFHLGAASADHAALTAIIEGLQDGGWEFVTVPELIAA
jgi:peptidoglycan/xylan/chitin deacetylase (PgdA/CDA1 family)